MNKIMIIGIEGDELVAVTPESELELGRNRVFHQDIRGYQDAAQGLVVMVFDDLHAKGFPQSTLE